MGNGRTPWNRSNRLFFYPFRLDPRNERLWRGEQQIPLRPKPFAILRYLVEHADTLVTKAELRAAVWGNTQVDRGVLKGYLRDLRQVLGDDAAAPRFIETVARRGYRFIGKVASSQHSVVSSCPSTQSLISHP